MSISSSFDSFRDEIETLENRFISLWDTILDNENGISGETYSALCDPGSTICPSFIQNVTKYVHETDDGRFFVPRPEETV